MGRRGRTRWVALINLVVAASLLASPATAAAASEASRQAVAYLDGSPIKLKDVANWYCDDFSYPVIHCFRDAQHLEDRRETMLAATAVNYVTVYDYASYAGSYMHMSQDNTTLVFIGWSDRISSFKGRNNEDGHFYVDWYFGGTAYYFCCNQLAASLGSFDNQFSSVHRN
jgi:hypothetical protein